MIETQTTPNIKDLASKQSVKSAQLSKPAKIAQLDLERTRSSYIGTYISSWLSRASIIALLGLTLAACGGGGGGGGTPNTPNTEKNDITTFAKLSWMNPPNVTSIEINRTTYADATSETPSIESMTIRTINADPNEELTKAGQQAELIIQSLEIGNVADGLYHEFTITPIHMPNSTSGNIRADSFAITTKRTQLSFPRITELKAELIDGGPEVTLSWTNPTNLLDGATIARVEVSVSIHASSSSAASAAQVMELSRSISTDQTSITIDTSALNADSAHYSFRVRPVFTVAGVAGERIAGFTDATPSRLQITIDTPMPPSTNTSMPPPMATNQAPDVATAILTTDGVTTTSGGDTVYERADNNFAISVTAMRQDDEGDNVIFPITVSSAGNACTARLDTAERASANTTHAVWIYEQGANALTRTVTYNVTYPGSDTPCGDFTFTAEEDGVMGSAAAYSGLSFVAVNQKPRVTTNRPSPYFHDRATGAFTIAVTATKQDALGSNNVSFPLSVTSTSDSNAGTEECIANLDETEKLSSNTTHATWTYPANELNSPRTVNYNVSSPTSADTNCGTFTFTATEDGETGEVIYRGLRFETHKAPEIAIDPTSAPIVHDREGNPFIIRVTATKQDSIIGSEVSFPLIVNSTADAGAGTTQCTASLDPARSLASSNSTHATWTYPASSLNSQREVTYRVTNPTSDITCGTFSFTAIEDGQDSEPATYSGLSYSTNEAPTMSLDPVRAIDDTYTRADNLYAIRVTATKQDPVGNEVSFPIKLTSRNGCIARLDTSGAIRQDPNVDKNRGRATFNYPSNMRETTITVTYRVTFPSSFYTTTAPRGCQDFGAGVGDSLLDNFSVTEDGKMTRILSYFGPNFRGTSFAPRVTTDPNVNVTHPSDIDFTINVTAMKQDALGGDQVDVNFPLEVESTAGPDVCRAVLVQTGGEEDGDNYVRTYPTNSFNSPVTVTYNVANPTGGFDAECGEFTFRAREDSLTGEVKYSGLSFENNKAPIVTTNPDTPVDHDRTTGDEFTIEVTATRPDSSTNTEVSFPVNVTSTADASRGLTACVANLVRTGGREDDDNYVRSYQANSVGAEVTVTYRVVNPTSDTKCGTFPFTATEDGETGRRKYSGLRLRFPHILPIVSINLEDTPVVHNREGDEFTIEVTTTKQDTEGTEVSFPLIVRSTSGTGVCTAVLIKADGTPDNNPVKTYPANSVGQEVTVTYSVTNPDSDITCGTFPFTVIEDDDTSEPATYSGLRLEGNKAPMVTTNPSGLAFQEIDEGDFTIEITATKQDAFDGTQVSFPIQVTSTIGSSGGKAACVATLVTTGIPDVTTTHANVTYPVNSAGVIGVGSNVTVMYTINNPTLFNSVGRSPECGEFTFTATEDDKEGTRTYSGLIFGSNFRPTISFNPARAALDTYTRPDNLYAIRVTAMKQDDLGNEVSFPISHTAPTSDGPCTAILDTSGAIRIDSGAGRATFNYPSHRAGTTFTATYRVIFPSAFYDGSTIRRVPACGGFDGFVAREDGKTSQVVNYIGPKFTPTELEPRVTTDPSVTLIHASNDNFTIDVTAIKQDELGGAQVQVNLSFPLEVESTAGPDVCRADLVRTGGEVDDNNYVRTYPANSFNSNVTVTYSVTNPIFGAECGTFRFTATEDGQEGSVEYSGLIFIDTTPAIVTNFIAIPSIDSVLLRWTNPNAQIGSFNLSVSNYDDDTGDLIASASNSAITTSITASLANSSYMVTGLDANTIYSFTLEPSLTGISSLRSTEESVLNRRVLGEDALVNRVALGANQDNDEYADQEDVDVDGDGLVELRNEVEFENIRDDLSLISKGGDTIGCPNNLCSGYELRDNIDLADLYLSDDSSWEPIGVNATNQYIEGDFEGNGNVIYNLNIEETPAGREILAGLFGAFAGDIRNLHLRNVSISLPTATEDIAALGALVGVYRGSGGSISNSSVAGDVINGVGFVGGVVGRSLSNLAMDNVSVDLDTMIGHRVGGLIGSFEGEGDTENLEIVTSTAIISQITGSDYTGGLIGNIDSDRPTRVGRSTVLANSIIGKTETGGIVGDVAKGEITIYASAVVADSITSDDEDAGGVLGSISSTSGALARVNIDSSTVIANNITGENHAGGLIGFLPDPATQRDDVTNLDGANIRSSSAIVDTITSTDVGGIIALADEFSIKISHSLAQNRIFKVTDDYGELGRFLPNAEFANSISVTSSYWQEGIIVEGAESMRFTNQGGGSAQSNTTLQNPDAPIFMNWKEGRAGWCNPTTGVYTQDDNPPDNSYVPVWNFPDAGTQGYPALNCLPITPDEQREAIGLVQNQQSPLSVFRRQ